MSGRGTGTIPDPLFIDRSGRTPLTPTPLTATWKYKVANTGMKNQWETVDIKCTFRQKRTRRVDPRGNYIASSATIRTTEDIQPDDVIIYQGKAWPVISVDNVHDINNTIIERIVYM